MKTEKQKVDYVMLENLPSELKAVFPKQFIAKPKEVFAVFTLNGATYCVPVKHDFDALTTACFIGEQLEAQNVARDAKIIELLACATNELPNGDCHQTIYWINKALSLLEVVESVD